MGSEGPVRIGIIGAGGIANLHLNFISSIEQIEPVAVVDVVEEAARRTAERWSIPDVYSDYNEMLGRDDIEAVFVCTPTLVHGPASIAAMEAGKHVLVEKPMEARLETAAEMVRTSRRTGKILMCALKLRFTQEVMAARRIVESGALGPIYYVEAVADRKRNTPGGTFIRKDLAGLGATADLGVYALDTALHIMGHPKPVSVAAVMSTFIALNADNVVGQSSTSQKESEVEDFAAAWIRFEDGATMVFKTSWSINLDNLGGTFFLGEKAGLRIGVGEVRGTSSGVQLFRDEFGTMTNMELERIQTNDMMAPFRSEQLAFAEAVRSGGPSPIDPEGVLLTNVIIQGVVDSVAAGGKEIAVSVPKVT